MSINTIMCLYMSYECICVRVCVCTCWCTCVGPNVMCDFITVMCADKIVDKSSYIIIYV